MQFEFDTLANSTLTKAIVAVVVTVVFYFFSLFSVYHRNQEYQKQKMAENMSNTTNKNESKSKTIKYQLQAKAFMINNDNREKVNESKSKSFMNKSDEANNKENRNEENINKETKHFSKNNGIFNPKAIISEKNKNRKKAPLPKVENLGCITLKELNEYCCTHKRRQLISIFGTIFDVSAAVDKYGTDGTYKEFAGHDITLALGTGKLNEKWLDRFVQFEPRHKQCAKGWMDHYREQYPTAGILEKWSENTRSWPKLTEQELNELNAECSIM